MSTHLFDSQCLDIETFIIMTLKKLSFAYSCPFLKLPFPTGHFPFSLPPLPPPLPITAPVAMESSSVASASSEAGSTRSQEIEELERFIDSYVLEYQVQGLLGEKADGDLDLDSSCKVPQVRAISH